jgi:hypothetical protein
MIPICDLYRGRKPPIITHFYQYATSAEVVQYRLDSYWITVIKNKNFCHFALPPTAFRFLSASKQPPFARGPIITFFIKIMITTPFFSRVFVLVSFVLLCNASFAQNADYRNTINANVALNGWQILALTDNFIDADTIIGGYMKATPTFGLSYDIGIKKWFSLGVQATFNKGQIGANDLSVTIRDKEYQGKAQIELRRLNLGFRPLFHFANSGRFDWYSGFRLGINYRVLDLQLGTDTDITDIEFVDYLIGNNWLLNRNYRGVRPTFQLIPLGMRGYLTENIALGVEVAIGTPYYLSTQLSYRF